MYIYIYTYITPWDIFGGYRVCVYIYIYPEGGSIYIHMYIYIYKYDMCTTVYCAGESIACPTFFPGLLLPTP